MFVAVKAFAVWLAIVVCAVANGLLREAVLVPQLGSTIGLALSGVLLSAVILMITFFTFPWLDAKRPAQLICIGLGWLILTVVFECALGRFQGKSWTSILDACAFKDGNMWPLVLLVTLAAPYIVARLRRAA